MPRGEKNKLTNQDRKEIYNLKGKISAYKLAEKYKVSHTTIYNLWKGLPPKTYKEALHKIRGQLETTRGLRMSTPVYNMWVNIFRIVNEALGDMP